MGVEFAGVSFRACSELLVIHSSPTTAASPLARLQDGSTRLQLQMMGGQYSTAKISSWEPRRSTESEDAGQDLRRQDGEFESGPLPEMGTDNSEPDRGWGYFFGLMGRGWAVYHDVGHNAGAETSNLKDSLEDSKTTGPVSPFTILYPDAPWDCHICLHWGGARVAN